MIDQFLTGLTGLTGFLTGCCPGTQLELVPKTGLFYGLRRVTPSRELVRRCAGAQRPRRQQRGSGVVQR